MIPIFIVNTFYIFALGLVIPTLPFMVLNHGVNPEFAAIILSAFSAAAFLAQPIWGILADKYGAKKILIASAVFTSLAYLGVYFSGNVHELFAARICAGLSAGWLTASLSYMSHVSSTKNRTKAMGLLGASFGIGFTIGPATSGIILKYYNLYELPALIAFFVTAIIAVVCIFILPKTKKIAPDVDNHIHKSFSALTVFSDKFHEIFYTLNLKILFLGYFLVSLIFTSLEGSFALWVKFILGRDAAFLSWVLTASGIVFIIIQGGLLGRLNKMFSEKALILLGISLLIVGFLILPFARHEILAFFPVILIAAGISLHNPCVQSLVSQDVREKNNGLALGLLQSCNSLSRVFGPTIAGYLFIYWGAFNFYVTCAGLLAMIFMLFLRFVNNQKHN